jgi:serine/threonine-protein kinase ATR
MGQGKTFEIPEKVPFRLTHNMVEAMGVNGVEGMFPFSTSWSLLLLARMKTGLI